MPRYKIICNCKTVFWVRVRQKLDDAAIENLKSNSCCPTCTELWKQRAAVLKAGVFSSALPQEHEECDKIIEKLKANEPWGFERMPFVDYAKKRLADEKESLAKGGWARYRGYSPTQAMFRARYRVMALEWMLDQAGV